MTSSDIDSDGYGMKMIFLVVLSFALLTSGSVCRAEGGSIFRTSRGVSLYLPFMEVFESGRVSNGSIRYYGDWAPMQQNGALAKLYQVGFDSVRLPISVRPLLDSPNLTLQILESEVAPAIRDMLGAGLNVIVDLHVGSVSKTWNHRLLTSSIDSPTFRSYETLVTAVAQFVSKFDPHRVAFELFNEPPPPCRWADRAHWSSFQKELFQNARKSAPHTTLILTGACWGSINGLKELRAADYDWNTIFTVHYYAPHIFTHQGTLNNEYFASYISRLPYPPSIDRSEEFLQLIETRLTLEDKLTPAAKKQVLTEAQRELRQYFRSNFSKDTMRQQLSEVAAWAKLNGVLPRRIWVGEFGVTKDIYGRTAASSEDRQRWFKDARSVFEEYGFSWAVWNYCCQGGIILGDHWGPLDPEIIRALGLRSEVTTQK